MSVTEKQAREVLRQREAYLLEQHDIEEFAVAAGPNGEVCIQIRSPKNMPEPRRSEIREQLGGKVPVEFGIAHPGKRAW